MRVALIGPTALDRAGRPIKQSRIHLPGLTLQMLAAVTPPDVQLRLVSETAEAIPFNERWDLVGLTGMGSGIARAWQISDEFRARGVRTVIGGIAASLCDPEWSLAHADSLVIGEAEEIWPEVLRDAQRGELQRVYRMSEPPDIATLPLPRYDMMKSRVYGRWTPVQATRGCPFTCSFCSITSYFNQRYRKRPVDQVIRDVRVAKRIRGSNCITFIDDNIGVDWDYCRELWTALIPEKIVWMSQCSLHIAERPDMMELAHRSGCRLLSFGIESLNAGSLDEIDKAWNRPARYAAAVTALRAHGIDVSTEMIVGFDHDDRTVFEQTYDFLMGNRISIPRVHILTPIPGTPLYRDLFDQGRITSREFGRFSGGKVVFHPKNFDPVDLESGYWKLYHRLFSWKGILHRVSRNRALLDPIMSPVVWGVNLHYRNHVHHGITPGIV